MRSLKCCVAMATRPDDALVPFLDVMRLFCWNEQRLVEWGEINREQIRAKLTDAQQEQLRQEFKAWRQQFRPPDGGLYPQPDSKHRASDHGATRVGSGSLVREKCVAGETDQTLRIMKGRT